MRADRDVACTTCRGEGGLNPETCSACNGQGVRVQVRQIGPGMVSQSQVACNKCSAKGKVFSSGPCVACKGQCTQKEKKDIEVIIPRGALDGHTCKFPGEADQLPNTVPGDVVVSIEVKPHEEFELKGYHLLRKHTITLQESLTGFTYSFKHLDGRVIFVQYDVRALGPVKPGQYVKIADEGMPRVGSVYNGNLYIQLDVSYPGAEWFANASNLQKVKSVLPAPTTTYAYSAGMDNVALANCDMNRDLMTMQQELKRQKQQEQQDMEDEEDHHHGGGQPACQAM